MGLLRIRGVKMCNYLQEYKERKQTVVDYINRTIDVLIKQGKSESADNLKKLVDNVKKGLFSIVLVGEFSAGKSTFLNALMGMRILPSFTSETTATVNFLRHSTEAPNGEAGIVYYNDGHQEVLKELTLDSVANVVSTKSNMGKEGVALSVDHVDLFLESEYLKNGIMLVDSPGLNGIAANHLEITRRQIEKSHAAIFMFSADHPGSKSDFEHLEELRSKSKNIFFVLNKINVINPSENVTVESVINDLKDSYHKKFPEENEIPEIWPVAANAALAARDKNYQYQNGEVVTTKARRSELEEISRMKAFEDRLMEYLTTGERTRDQLLEPVNKSIESLKRLKDTLDDEKQGLSNKEIAEDFLKEKEAVEKQQKELKRNKKSILEPIRGEIVASISRMKNAIGSNIERIQENISDEIKLLDDPEELCNFADDLEDILDRKYRHLIRNIQDDVYSEILEIAQNKCYDYLFDLDQKFNAIHDASLDINLNKRFEIKEINISANIQSFNNQIEELEAEIAKINNGTEDLQQKISATSRKESLIEDLKSRKRELQERRNYIIDNFPIPPKEISYGTEEYYRDRKGVFGVIVKVFCGKKKDTQTVKRVYSEAHDNAIEERDGKIEIINRELEEINIELTKINNPELDSSYFRSLLERNDKQKDALFEKIQDLNEKIQDNINASSKKECRLLKKQIKKYVEERSDDLENLLKKVLDGQKNKYLEAVKEIVARSIDNELTECEERLAHIVNVIHTNGKDRDNRLKEIETSLEEIGKLMEAGIDLKTELQSNLQGYIRQSSIIGGKY